LAFPTRPARTSQDSHFTTLPRPCLSYGAHDRDVLDRPVCAAAFVHDRYRAGGVMGAPALGVLRPGDWVSFDGDDHQVVAVAGPSVRLRSAAGVEQVVLAAHLMASPDFAVLTDSRCRGWSRSGCWTACRTMCWLRRGEWERHVVEVDIIWYSGSSL